MEIVRSIDAVRGRIRITFESGWQVWLLKTDPAGSRLAEGSEVDREKLLKHLLLRQYPPALSRAVSMLAARACSRKEIESALIRNHYDPEVVRMVLLKLDQQNLLDDRDFAVQWVQSRMKKYGSGRIQQELRRKGVDEEAARAAMESVSEEEQLEHAVAFAVKKLSSLRGSDDRRKQVRLTVNALVRRGYSWETALRAADQAMAQSDS